MSTYVDVAVTVAVSVVTDMRLETIVVAVAVLVEGFVTVAKEVTADAVSVTVCDAGVVVESVVVVRTCKAISTASVRFPFITHCCGLSRGRRLDR